MRHDWTLTGTEHPDLPGEREVLCQTCGEKGYFFRWKTPTRVPSNAKVVHFYFGLPPGRIGGKNRWWTLPADDNCKGVKISKAVLLPADFKDEEEVPF